MSAPTFQVHNPATGAGLATLPEQGRVETIAAVARAAQALARECPAAQRQSWLAEIAATLLRERDEVWVSRSSFLGRIGGAVANR